MNRLALASMATAFFLGSSAWVACSSNNTTGGKPTVDAGATDSGGDGAAASIFSLAVPCTDTIASIYADPGDVSAPAGQGGHHQVRTGAGHPHGRPAGPRGSALPRTTTRPPRRSPIRASPSPAALTSIASSIGPSAAIRRAHLGTRARRSSSPTRLARKGRCRSSSARTRPGGRRRAARRPSDPSAKYW